MEIKFASRAVARMDTNLISHATTINNNMNKIKDIDVEVEEEVLDYTLEGQTRQRYSNKTQFQFKFGAYEGFDIDEVPTSYLKRASGWDLHDYIIQQIENELEFRGIDIYDFDDNREGDR